MEDDHNDRVSFHQVTTVSFLMAGHVQVPVPHAGTIMLGTAGKL